MIIKVCGMREPDNIRQLSELQADFLGLIFYVQSPRAVDPEDNALAETLSGLSVPTAGVFVDSEPSRILATAHRFKLNMIQLHGDESPAVCEILRKDFQVVKAFCVGEDIDPGKLLDYADVADWFLFDTRSSVRGGSGKKFNWNILNASKIPLPFLISGGIGPGDVQRIKEINLKNFLGIDVNSRFEIRPGLKNIELLKSFILKLR